MADSKLAEKDKDALYPSFSGTIRPKGGITQDWVDALMKLLNKGAHQWKVVCEKYNSVEEEYTAESHLHFGVIWKNPMSAGNCKQKVERFFKAAIKKGDIENAEGTNLKVAILMKRWYEGSGWDEYMDKDMDVDTKVEAINIDKDIRDYLWPNIPVEDRKRKAAWAEYAGLERIWKEERKDSMPAKPEDCAQFFNEMAYAKRRIGLPKTGKEMRCKAVHLFRYLHKYRGSHCIDDMVDEMRVGISGPAMAGGFSVSAQERQSEGGYN